MLLRPEKWGEVRQAEQGAGVCSPEGRSEPHKQLIALQTYVVDLPTFVLSLRNYLVFISLLFFSSPFLWTAYFIFPFCPSLTVCVFFLMERLLKAIASISIGGTCLSPRQPSQITLER